MAEKNKTFKSNEASYKFGISQKAIIYDPQEDKYLLLKSKDGYFSEKYGPWDLAGGTMNPGESFQEALDREIKEEVGEIDYEALDVIASEKILNSDGGEKIFLGNFVRWIGKEIKISEEHMEYKWESYKNITEGKEYKPWLKNFIEKAQKYMEKHSARNASPSDARPQDSLSVSGVAGGKNTFFITVKAVVLNAEGKVLILKRPQHEKSGAGKYDLPGGSIEQGEDIKMALNREIKEETGLEAEIGPVIHAFDFEETEQREIAGKTTGKGVRFLAYYRNGEVNLDGKEHASFEWLEIDEAIKKFADKGFEKDKRDSLVKAKEHLELKNSLDGWKRCQADFENYKKRQSEAQKDLTKYACLNVVMEILPILDNFYASTDHIPADQKDTPWVVGIMHIQKQLEDVLKNYGVTEIETKVGDEFDPELHEAVTDNQQPTTDNPKNKIAKIVQRGYKIDGKVIRAARVIVE